MRHFWLNFHVGYACRHSGVCCSSGWPIPVERDRVIPIRSLTGRPDDEWLVPTANAPADVAGTLAVRSNGECTFFRVPTSNALPPGSALPPSRAVPAGAAGCGVHAARPASCAHFPFVCLIDARGAHVTLSHYCPTAASMLFEDHGPIAIVEGPSPVAGFEIPEGLDARESLPPAFAETSTSAEAAADRSAGKPHAAKMRLMSWDAFSAWERKEVTRAIVDLPLAQAIALFEHARAAVPAPWSWPAAPSDLEHGWSTLVAPAWPAYAPVVQRYRAAKVFASWAAYTSGGLAAVQRVAGIADTVLRVEAVRQCVTCDRVLDAELLQQAIRQADLLLVHYADAGVLSSADPL